LERNILQGIPSLRASGREESVTMIYLSQVIGSPVIFVNAALGSLVTLTGSLGFKIDQGNKSIMFVSHRITSDHTFESFSHTLSALKPGPERRKEILCRNHKLRSRSQHHHGHGTPDNLSSQQRSFSRHQEATTQPEQRLFLHSHCTQRSSGVIKVSRDGYFSY